MRVHPVGAGPFMFKRAYAWPQIVLGVYWLTLFVGTHWPKPPGLDVPGRDKTLHAVAFAILTGLLLSALTRQGRLVRGWPIALTAIAIVAIYAALDEWTQPYVGRTCDLLDWTADLVGAVSVCLGYLIATRLGPARR
jgi:VanZ family protein